MEHINNNLMKLRWSLGKIKSLILHHTLHNLFNTNDEQDAFGKGIHIPVTNEY
jgi:hypothetical protein